MRDEQQTRNQVIWRVKGTAQPPGWYPDPYGAKGQRWYTGQLYTEHFVPATKAAAILSTQMPRAPAPMPGVAPAGWYPTGPGMQYWDGRRWTIVSIPWAPTPSPTPTGWARGHVWQLAGAGLGGLIVIAVQPVLFVWLVVAGVFVVTTMAAVRWTRANINKRLKRRRLTRYRREIVAARADFEDMLWRSGDARGIHGRYPPPP